MENFHSEELPRVNPFLRAVSLIWFYFKKRFLLRRVHQLSLEYVDDVPLLTLPEVLNAGIFRGGTFLAHTVAHHKCAAPSHSTPYPLALDMGTGSGIGAIFASRRGYRVIGVDINPEAVPQTCQGWLEVVDGEKLGRQS